MKKLEERSIRGVEGLQEKFIKQVQCHPYTEHTYKRIVHVNDLPARHAGIVIKLVQVSTEGVCQLP